MGISNIGSRNRRVSDNPVGSSEGSASYSGSGTSKTTMSPAVELAEPVSLAGGRGSGAVHKPLQSKQGTTSTSLTPIHVSGIDECDTLIERLDANINFVTSMTANQPAATIFDRIRAYERASKGWEQFAEVEGRAFPVSAYFTAYIRHLLHEDAALPGVDSALTFNQASAVFAHYVLATGFGQRKTVRVENVIKAQPFVGVGAVSNYAENEGAAAFQRGPVLQSPIAPYWVARSYGANISSIYASRVRGFMLAAPADINSGFVIKVGGRAYVTEEINDIEDRINSFLFSLNGSITGTFGTAVRGVKPPQDPFTGASVFLFSDLFPDPKLPPQDLSIVINTPQAVQIAVLTDAGIDCLST